MSVYVDEFRLWLPKQPRPFHNGSSHMTADTLDELHAMAARIGMKRAWFQDHPLAPHYDLTEQKRVRAMVAGAVFVPCREQARRRLGRLDLRRSSCGCGGTPPCEHTL